MKYLEFDSLAEAKARSKELLTSHETTTVTGYSFSWIEHPSNGKAALKCDHTKGLNTGELNSLRDALESDWYAEIFH